MPVEERSQPPAERINLHRVSAGETLYSIAWRYTLDPGELAARNRLAKPYKLRVGQQLELDKQGLKPVAKPSVQTPVIAKKNNSPVTIKPSKWIWPAQGKVDRVFAAKHNVHKGIDITGRSGQAIVAAESGVIVYAGNGLAAYGNLIIVKHHNQLLSAYAHNKRLLVKEGQTVKAGEKIAEMGRSGTNKEHLHFEIRKNGHPIDPLTILPKRTAKQTG